MDWREHLYLGSLLVMFCFLLGIIDKQNHKLEAKPTPHNASYCRSGAASLKPAVTLLPMPGTHLCTATRLHSSKPFSEYTWVFEDAKGKEHKVKVKRFDP
jgi:hypothetical protein